MERCAHFCRAVAIACRLHDVRVVLQHEKEGFGGKSQMGTSGHITLLTRQRACKEMLLKQETNVIFASRIMMAVALQQNMSFEPQKQCPRPGSRVQPACIQKTALRCPRNMRNRLACSTQKASEICFRVRTAGCKFCVVHER